MCCTTGVGDYIESVRLGQAIPYPNDAAVSQKTLVDFRDPVKRRQRQLCSDRRV